MTVAMSCGLQVAMHSQLQLQCICRCHVLDLSLWLVLPMSYVSALEIRWCIIKHVLYFTLIFLVCSVPLGRIRISYIVVVVVVGLVVVVTLQNKVTELSAALSANKYVFSPFLNYCLSSSSLHYHHHYLHHHRENSSALITIR